MLCTHSEVGAVFPEGGENVEVAHNVQDVQALNILCFLQMKCRHTNQQCLSRPCVGAFVVSLMQRWIFFQFIPWVQHVMLKDVLAQIQKTFSNIACGNMTHIIFFPNTPC